MSTEEKKLAGQSDDSTTVKHLIEEIETSNLETLKAPYLTSGKKQWEKKKEQKRDTVNKSPDASIYST